ncbi:uncharacterized protein LOC128278862 [Anopheles cruzii]|uniref:uncharacterized protein LOC128278862 n=1 Tax=Anopheles cruzii TaxID=68878 RepID=UPI0022EC729D|nr:uncharacterized protein LOC128278862 [Anopheles cruzii]
MGKTKTNPALKLQKQRRYGSTSSQVSQSSGDICRICHCESDTLNPLLTPCYCSGSLKFVHQTCLQQWLTASETNACELCKFPFIMHTKIKPFNEWRSLDMSGVERRRLCCAVLFHCAAGLCVIWSLCVLIERAAEEVRRGQIGWPFWTKLIVVTVGLTGGVVFMYIQCKQYLSLCNRWRARNRILLIQNAPEKIHPPQSPPMPQFRRVRTAATSGQQYPQQAIGSMGINAIDNATGAGGGAGSSGQLMSRTCDQPLGTVSSSSGANHCELQINHQGQIIAANIESTSIGYDRDWTLDDISQVSFKPCPQGSGSLTPMPFHDSVHNICEANGSGAGGGNGIATGGANSQHRYSTASNTSNSLALDPLQSAQVGEQISNNSTTATAAGGASAKATELGLFKLSTASERSRSSSPNVAPGSTGVGRYANSAVFLENRDILNDPSSTPGEGTITAAGHVPSPYPSKVYHRHSTVLAGSGPSLTSFARADVVSQGAVSGDEIGQHEPNKSFRRYSDTKLLQKQSLSYPQEPLALCEIGSHTKDQLLLNPKSIIYDMSGLLGAPVVVPVDADVTMDGGGVHGSANHRHSHHSHLHHHHHHHVHHRHHHPTYQSAMGDRSEECPHSTPQTTDIQFESSGNGGAITDDDTLEMNIQDILEYDQQQHRQYLPPEQHNRRTEQQRLSLENILQSASYHDDPSIVACRPYHDHQGISSMISSLSLSSKAPHAHMELALTSPFTGYQSSPQSYPPPRSSMAGTLPSSSSRFPAPHGPLQQQRSHCTTVDANQCHDEEGSNKLKLFKSLPNLSASSENLLP